jgi:hypothetical protein
MLRCVATSRFAVNCRYLTHVPEEKCLLRFAEQFNYGFTNSKVNESFEFDDDRVQKFYDVKREDGVPLKYNVYMINEPTTSSHFVIFRKR